MKLALILMALCLSACIKADPKTHFPPTPRDLHLMAERECLFIQTTSAKFPTMAECVAWDYRVIYQSLVLGIQPPESTGPPAPPKQFTKGSK